MVHCIIRGIKGFNFEKFRKLILSYQGFHTLMKCLNMRHFIWVFTVCQSTHLGFLVFKGCYSVELNQGQLILRFQLVRTHTIFFHVMTLTQLDLYKSEGYLLIIQCALESACTICRLKANFNEPTS